MEQGLVNINYFMTPGILTGNSFLESFPTPLVVAAGEAVPSSAAEDGVFFASSIFRIGITMLVVGCDAETSEVFTRKLGFSALIGVDGVTGVDAPESNDAEPFPDVNSWNFLTWNGKIGKVMSEEETSGV